MRPSILYPLFAPIEVLKGIGNKYAKLVKNLCGCRRSFRHKMAEYGPEL